MKRVGRDIVFVMVVFFVLDSNAQVLTTADSGTTVRITAPSLSTDRTKGNATYSDESTIYILRKDSREPETIRLWQSEMLEIGGCNKIDSGALLGLGIAVGVGVILTVTGSRNGRRLLDRSFGPADCSPWNHGWGDCKYSARLGDGVSGFEMTAPGMTHNATRGSPTRGLCRVGLLDIEQFRRDTSSVIVGNGQSDAGSVIKEGMLR